MFFLLLNSWNVSYLQSICLLWMAYLLKIFPFQSLWHNMNLLCLLPATLLIFQFLLCAYFSFLFPEILLLFWTHSRRISWFKNLNLKHFKWKQHLNFLCIYKIQLSISNHNNSHTQLPGYVIISLVIKLIKNICVSELILAKHKQDYTQYYSSHPQILSNRLHLWCKVLCKWFDHVHNLSRPSKSLTTTSPNTVDKTIC